jgi:hypothetical protein
MVADRADVPDRRVDLRGAAVEEGLRVDGAEAAIGAGDQRYGSFEVHASLLGGRHRPRSSVGTPTRSRFERLVASVECLAFSASSSPRRLAARLAREGGSDACAEDALSAMLADRQPVAAELAGAQDGGHLRAL